MSKSTALKADAPDFDFHFLLATPSELRMDKKMPSEMITGHSFTTNPTSKLQTRPTCDSFRCHSTTKLNKASNERTT